MPCVCKKICGEPNTKPNMQPYRNGLKYCAVCKVFTDSNKVRCSCCNGRLRTNTRGSNPKFRAKEKFVE